MRYANKRKINESMENKPVMKSALAIKLGSVVFAFLVLICTGCAAHSNSGNTVDVPANQIIVVFGASGKIGGLIVTEALNRGHEVIGVSRNPEKMSFDHDAFLALKGDVTSVDSFREVTAGADAVVISVQGVKDGNLPAETTHARSAATAATALRNVSYAPYVLQIGGATTIHNTKEAMLQNLPFPVKDGSWTYATFLGHLVALETYRASEIDWTVLTPPYMIRGWTGKKIINNTRTGEYATFNEGGAPKQADGSAASILVADLAVAAIDEIENRQFVRRRFVAASKFGDQ